MPTPRVLKDMMVGTILAQSRPADTNATSVYSPLASVNTEITQVLVCNTTGNTPSFRVFLDGDGTTYDQTTALYYDVAMAANTTTALISHDDGGWWMNDSDGNLAVRTSAANELTFTVFGMEHQI